MRPECRDPRRRRLWLAAMVAMVMLAAPGSWARAPVPRAVQDQVDRWASHRDLGGVNLGIAVADLNSGKMIAQRNGLEVLNAASGTKLLTTAAALAILGPDHRWITHFELEGSTLVVRGGGDPKLLPEDMAPLADVLAKGLADAGVTRLTAIRLDLSRYDLHQLPPAYAQKSTDAGYRPSIGSLGSSYGAVRVDVAPTRVGYPVKVTVTPKIGIEVLSEGVTSHGAESTITIRGEPTPDGLIRIVIRGELGVDHPADWVRRRVPDPNQLTGALLRGALSAKGLAEPSTPLILGRGPRAAMARKTLARHESDDLATTISDINTWSNNYMAEVLFKELGLAPGKPATWERAAPRITTRLARLGVEARELRVVNGSGLYRGTLVSPRAMTQLLAAMAKDPKLGPIFRASLARPGRPGTLSTRLKGLATRDRVWAKTGTLDEVVSLAGYIQTSGGHPLAFAILINEATPQRTATLRKAIDRLVSALSRL